MGIAEAIALALGLLSGVRNAVNAGTAELSEDDVDLALAELEAGDSAISDAIARARARREAGGP